MSEKPHLKQYEYMKERFTVDAISHIVDKIKIRKTSYVLGLLDFFGAFDHIP